VIIYSYTTRRSRYPTTYLIQTVLIQVFCHYLSILTKPSSAKDSPLRPSSQPSSFTEVMLWSVSRKMSPMYSRPSPAPYGSRVERTDHTPTVVQKGRLPSDPLPTGLPQDDYISKKHGLAGNRTPDHSQACSSALKALELMLREYYTTKPQARCQACCLI
jgi:hypothetical protein